MPIGLGLASSHAPAIDYRADQYEPMYQRITVARGIPQPPGAALETPEVIDSYIQRVQSSFNVLEEQLKAYNPELLIMIGGDQTEMFDESNVPNLLMFLGDAEWGHNTLRGNEPSEEDIVRFKVDVPTSKRLLNRLVEEAGFDIAFSEEQVALGTPAKGLPHAWTRPAPYLLTGLNVPVLILYMNTYQPPSLTAQRCFDLGRAIAREFKNDPRRIAIYGSGGLSHDPGGPRSGWVDEPLDRWFLDKLQTGEAEDVTALYGFDSLTMRGGTGEIRAWIVVAGAMHEMSTRATVVDYIPAHHAVCGLGWAYWPVTDER